MTNSDAGSELSMMATVNRVIDELHASLGLADSAFFCECGRIGCKEQITLTRSEYADLRRDDRPLLATEHADRRDDLPAHARGPAPTDASQLRGVAHGR